MAAERLDRFAEIKRCLAKADEAFAMARKCEIESDRSRLIEEAEGWLIRAERVFARLTDRMAPTEAAQRRLMHEHRSFEKPAADPALVWRAGAAKPDH